MDVAAATRTSRDITTSFGAAAMGLAAWTPDALAACSHGYRGTGGVSEENAGAGFRPAFLDAETGIVYRSRFRDGNPAPFHLLDGLPDELILQRGNHGRVTAAKGSLVSGFVRCSRFYTRDEAAAALSAVTCD